MYISKSNKGTDFEMLEFLRYKTRGYVKGIKYKIDPQTRKKIYKEHQYI